MKKFTVTIKLTHELISDVLCSALEGGSNYWIQKIQLVEPSEWLFDSEPERGIGMHWTQDYPLNPGGALLISSDDGVLTLDWDAIQKGLTVLATDYPYRFCEILDNNYDANTADAFLQCCLLGGGIYS
jgi:hypothetical protein